jgi:hypothetical protein
MGPVMVRLSAARAGVGSNTPHARPAEQHEAARASTSGARELAWRNTPGREGARRDAHDESGSQTIEFALVVPAALLLLVLILHAGVMAADLVAAQGLAREAARAAAVSDDGAARAVTHSAAGRRPVESRSPRLRMPERPATSSLPASVCAAAPSPHLAFPSGYLPRPQCVWNQDDTDTSATTV